MIFPKGFPYKHRIPQRNLRHMTDFEFFDFQTADSFLEGISMGENPNIGKSSTDWNDIYASVANPNFTPNLVASAAEDTNTASMMNIPSNMSSNSSNESPLESSTHTSPELKDDDYKPKAMTTSKITKPKGKDKTSHNMIEKKYRTNINSKILALRDAVPSLRIAAGSKDVSIADLEGLTPASKLNKASVLTKATEYIKHLESKNEILMQQNAQLRSMIEGANTHQVQPVMPPQQPQQPQQHLFGYYPQEPLYNATPVQQSYSGSSQYTPESSTGSQYSSSGSNNNLLLGGMATMMATSLFAGLSDYKGMSVLPIGPIWRLAQLFMIAAVVVSISRDNLRKFKTSKGEWNVLAQVDDNRREEILQQLLGKQPVTMWGLLSHFFSLCNSEPNFENVLLSVIVGKLSVRRWRASSLVIALKLHSQMVLLKNLEYLGDNESIRSLSKVVKLLGLQVFDSENVMGRVSNMLSRLPINHEVFGPNGVKYVEIKMESDDLYAIINQWALLEVLDDITGEVLVNICSEDASAEKAPSMDSISALIPKSGVVHEYARLVRAVTDDEYAPQFLRETEARVKRDLGHFGAMVNPIVDDEWDDDDTEVLEEETEQENLKQESLQEEGLVLKEMKEGLKVCLKLVGSLNLVSEEEFVVLASSLTTYFFKNGMVQELAKLVSRLKLANKHLSTIAFASVAKMIEEVVPGVEEDTVDEIIGKCRGWLEEVKMDFEMKARLSKLMVEKGKVVGGIE